MKEFLSCFASLFLMPLVPPLVFGLAVWICHKVFCVLVGTRSGRPLLLSASVLSVPLREAGHAIACMLFFHRIEEICLFRASDPGGELGYIEHSYHSRNPIARFGNFVYALAPVALGLFAVLVIFLSCFGGVFGPFVGDMNLLRESSAPFGDYVRLSLSLIPQMAVGGTAGVLSRIIGTLALVMICLGIHVAPSDLADSLFGLLVYMAVAAVTSLVLVLIDVRVARTVIDAVGGFSAAITALFIPVLLSAVVLLAVSAVFFLIRTLRHLDSVND